MVRLLMATGLPMHVRAISADADIQRRIEMIRTNAAQEITVCTPTHQLPDLVRASDLVVTAAGSSVGELLCVGTAVALATVTPRQEPVYQALLKAGLAIGLGPVDLFDDAAVQTLRSLLLSPGRRAELRDRGREAVDGQGAARVAATLLAMADARGEDTPILSGCTTKLLTSNRHSIS
ncbi:glycosyltransferase family 28 protein [Streptacidiphilus sp. PAMC 29251]